MYLSSGEDGFHEENPPVKAGSKRCPARDSCCSYSLHFNGEQQSWGLIRFKHLIFRRVAGVGVDVAGVGADCL
ncbi:MAG: hypothetical protein LBS55_01760 [Prevotellaceae bacterium]|jgi:hypothetical protein|nr:hypothetical protein [Prevotellaceae bacterium]